MLRSSAMTIGQLSKQSDVPIKVLRTYADLGFLCTRGRSESNYRLFGEEALRCVQAVQNLRSLGLTLKEIQVLVIRSCQQEDSSAEELLQAYLALALARIETQINTLQARRERILEFQATGASPASRRASSVLMQMVAAGPSLGTEHAPLDSPSGGRVYTLSVSMFDHVIRLAKVGCF